MKKTVITNPVIWADVPDLSVIRVGSCFLYGQYEHAFMPGCPIMRSVNLKDWEIVNYVFDTLEHNDAHNCSTAKAFTGKAHGRQIFATTKARFMYVFPAMILTVFMCIRRKILRMDRGNVIMAELFHDPSLLFDDGRVFVIYGNGEIRRNEYNGGWHEIKTGWLG